jgi:S1-C subfamily serine protease
MGKKIPLVFLILALFFMLAKADVVSPPYIEAIQRSTVRLFYYVSFINLAGQPVERLGQCTGVVIGSHKILSVYHLVAGLPPGEPKAVIRYFNNSGETAAGIVSLTLAKFDSQKDLAIYEFKENLFVAPAEIADNITIGDQAILCGYNALGIPAVRFSRVMVNSNGIMFHPVFYGDSGAPIFDSNGKVIGIISELLVINSVDHVLIGVAIPQSVIKEFLQK